MPAGSRRWPTRCGRCCRRGRAPHAQSCTLRRRPRQGQMRSVWRVPACDLFSYRRWVGAAGARGPGGLLGPVALPPEAHPLVVDRDELAVGDRHPVRVARQVGQHRLRPDEGSLGVDHPFGLAHGCQPSPELASVAQAGVLAEELQTADFVQPLQLPKEPEPEQPRVHPHRQATQVLPSAESPPPGTMPCTCGWCVIAEPQVLGVHGDGLQHFVSGQRSPVRHP